MKYLCTIALFAVLVGITAGAAVPGFESTQGELQDALLRGRSNDNIAVQEDEPLLDDYAVEQIQEDASCVDNARKELCDKFRDVHKLCKSKDANMKAIANNYCKKTCGLCTAAPTPTKPQETKSCTRTKAGCCGDMITPAEPGKQCPIELGCPDAMDALKLHNQLRARHGAPPLKWDAGLYAQAMDWAKYLASINTMTHSGVEDQGENLAFFWMPPKPASEATQVWYDEVSYYNYNDPDNNYQSLHFTQLVWKATTSIGIGCAKTYDGQYTHIVARYSPRGNWQGEFSTNVH